MVSIIVPVFNCEKYVSKCIESIIQQSYVDWELLLIDDCSTDSSLEICKKYANESHKINVFSLDKNSGPSHARNIGLIQARGEWITFVDSDDYIDSEYLTILTVAAEKSNADICICSLKNINKGKEVVYNSFNPSGYICFTGKEKKEITDIIINGRTRANKPGLEISGPVCKLIRRKLIDSISFDENIRLGEDTLFSIQTYMLSDKIIYVNKALYCRVERDNSLSNGIGKKYYKRRAMYVNRMIKYLDYAGFSEVEINTFLYENLKNIIYYYFAAKCYKRFYIDSYQKMVSKKICYDYLKKSAGIEVFFLRNSQYICYFFFYAISVGIRLVKGKMNESFSRNSSI